ncbi:MAG: helix-turn-helix domain-containing protein [Bacteroidales bacterium]|jgi:AraC-like DNA-binding protein/Tfp pilus assembly protein PilF|nr:helix-turn-helix domain-containing protein [Bacteroidales bacterium]
MFEKKIIAFAFSFFSVVGLATGQKSTFNDDNIASKYKHLSAKQLHDTARYHHFKNNHDTALVCYNLLISSMSQEISPEHRQMMMTAYNNAAIIYLNMSNYSIAYELLNRALQLSETCDTTNNYAFYLNMGCIYLALNEYDLAKLRFLEVLDIWTDSLTLSIALNNLGYIEMKDGNFDKAFNFINQAIQIGKGYNTRELAVFLNSMGRFYMTKKNYDSAYGYYQLALQHAYKLNDHLEKTKALSDLGNLFFEINKLDSAVFYINLANTVATEHEFLKHLMENFSMLSKIAKARGNKTLALSYLEQYAVLKDSILNYEKVAEINQIRRFREASKANKQIEQLTVEQRIKQKTIHFQYILMGVFALIGMVLTVVVVQSRKLNVSYKKLFEKNIEIVELREHSSEIHPEKSQKNTLTDEVQNELLNRIYDVMKDTLIVCDTEFSLEKLADLVQSNRTYVSAVINDVLQKNFRTFINEYRIREAQRLFSEKDASKHTIEFIAEKTGFKSRSTFNVAFKDVTGVSPGFYLKSLHK